MRVLVACEFSGIVRDAFIEQGHEAWSCDLIDTHSPGPHLKGDVLDYLSDEWDLMVAFPPCEHLAASGARWFAGKVTEQADALDFVRRLWEAPIERIAIENPVGILSTHIRKPDQIIQPWQFGHDASKKTCLWLKNLPPLLPTGIIPPAHIGNNGKWYYSNQTPSGQNKLGQTRSRSMERSKTYQGIAQAMAVQWGVSKPG